MFKLDIVIPIFNEEENLSELHRRLRAVCDGVNGADWRVVFVNDGSDDKSLSIMQTLCNQDKRFSVIDLSRNFGHQPAIAAGLAQAEGDAVIIMDGDLQDPPELITELVASWQGGAQVVRAERRSRQEKGLRRMGFDLFHKFFGWISDFPLPSQTGIFGLMDRQAVMELNRFPEKNRFFPGLRGWVGFKQGVVYYDRKDRRAGEPKQSFSRLVRYALDGIFSFSYKPLRIMTGTGALISSVGFLLAFFFVIRRLVGIEIAQTGFTTLVTLVLFLGGVQLIAIGLLGEYLLRIYDEVKERPLYIVKSQYGPAVGRTGNKKKGIPGVSDNQDLSDSPGTME
jgi:glycosyltransferase involved in cell wall biosynthesis